MARTRRWIIGGTVCFVVVCLIFGLWVALHRTDLARDVCLTDAQLDDFVRKLELQKTGTIANMSKTPEQRSRVPVIAMVEGAGVVVLAGLLVWMRLRRSRSVKRRDGATIDL